MSRPDRVPEANPKPGFAERIPEWVLKRATGAPRIDGNTVRLQFDGPLTFDAWVEAIARAEGFIHFENYIIRDDRVGRVFKDALISKARAGLRVSLLYDWMGSWATPRRFWKGFREAGVEVRAFNRPSIRDPFGIFQRDHRKMVCVDGSVAFIGGFCVGQEWAGDRAHPPWRDTGIEIQGPAAAGCAQAFEKIWETVGDPVPGELLSRPDAAEAEGDTPVWIIEGEPWRSRVYRETQLLAASARKRIWITDPYFVAPFPVAEALVAAARDGVDVRIVLPAHNNWPWVGSLSRGGYRGLLEAGVRIFEWQGPMIHAKTMVVDGAWSRIGSSNMNSASLLGNWEIDAGVLDEGLAAQLEGLFLADLTSSMEIVLPRTFGFGEAPPSEPLEHTTPAARETLDPGRTLQERFEKWKRRSPGATALGMPALVRAGSTLGDSIAGHRTLGREDRTVLGTVAVSVLILALVAGVFPYLVGWLIAFLAGWFGIVLGVRALLQARRARREEVLAETLARDVQEALPAPKHPGEQGKSEGEAE